MATSKVLKPRRGSTTEHATFKGQAFEITFDTDKKTIVAHDGLTMGGFPLAHEADVAETDSALRALIDQKVSEVEGVSSSELRALESALRGLINNNAQQQVVRDNDQDNVIAVIDSEVSMAMSAANAAQSSADAAAENVTTIEAALRELIADLGGEVEAAKNSVPVGMVIAYASNDFPPGGYLVCNGAAISRTTYAALFSVIGTTYGAGDGSTTFNLPTLSDGRFIEGSHHSGDYFSAGLPEVYGFMRHIPMLTAEHGGVITMNNGVAADIDIDSGATYMRADVHITASLGNATYGASATVQPRALTMRYFIKY